MKKKLLSFALALAVCLGLSAPFAAYAASELQTQQIYQAMIALKDQYPEGTPWTNDNFYEWKGGIYSGGGGCAGFAFMLSDAAFGRLPARMLRQFSFSDVRTGDILRVNNDTHTVIVLEVKEDGVVIAEGNYNSSIHWGRILTQKDVLAADYLLTRYPEGAEQDDPVEDTQDDPAQPNPPEIDPPEDNPPEVLPPENNPSENDPSENNPSEDTPPEDGPDAAAPVFQDVPADAYYADAVRWAVERGVTKGTSSTEFSPDLTCSTAHILSFLYRANGSPEPAAANPFEDVADEDYYCNAARWAAEKQMVSGNIFAGGAPCTRASTVMYLWQAAGSPAPSVQAGFSDVPADAPYVQAVAWAVEQGITQGTSASTFTPDKVCSRGEIVTFLFRAMAQ